MSVPPMNPAWAATDPTAGAEPSPTSRTWAPEYTLPNRPASGPLTRDRQPLAGELKPGSHADPMAMPSVADPVAAESAPDSEAYRYHPDYHTWYYSQHPRDPRVPPPLGNVPLAGRNAPTAAAPTGTPQAGPRDSPAVSPGSSLTQMPESQVLAALQARGGGVRPVQHPLAALRRSTANNSGAAGGDTPQQSSMIPPAPRNDAPPLRSLGPVGRPAVTPPGKFEGSASIAHDAGQQNDGDALEGSAAAATWIDGLPIPTSLNASAMHGKSRASSHSSRDSRGGKKGSKYAPNRGQPSPTLRQYKEEAMQQAHSGKTDGRTPVARGGTPQPTNQGTPVAESQPAGDSVESKPAAGEGANTTTPLPFDKPYQPPRGVWDFMAISGHVVEFACDQDGSRLVQSLLEDPFNLTSIFCEVHSSLPILVSHQFGNYCAQRLLELGKPTHKLAVMGAMKGRMAQLAVDTYGCRVIQRALDTITDETSEEMTNLAKELEGHVATLVVDQNGNHVVQKLMDRMPPHKYGTTFLVTSFVGRMHDIGMHCYGCRVIQKLFETCGDGAKFAQDAPGSPHLSSAVRAMNLLVQDVIQNIHSLVVDQYGNYVVQHLIANGCRETRSKAIASLTPRVPELSVQKFSSNVVERLLACAVDSERDNVVGVLCSARTFSAQALPPIVDMTRDKFANYVVQRLIELATPHQKESLVAALAPHVNEIRTTTYGVHLLSRLERIGWLPQGSSGLAVPQGGGMRGGRGRGRGFGAPLGPMQGRGGHGEMNQYLHHQQHQHHSMQQPQYGASQSQAPSYPLNPYDPSYQSPQQFTPYAQAPHTAYTQPTQSPYAAQAQSAAPSYSLFSGSDGQLYASSAHQHTQHATQQPANVYGQQTPSPYGAWSTTGPAQSAPYVSAASAATGGTLYAQQYAALQQSSTGAPTQAAYGAQSAPAAYSNPYSPQYVTATAGPYGTQQQQQQQQGQQSTTGYGSYAMPTQQQTQQQQPQQHSHHQPAGASAQPSGMLDPSKLTPQEQQMLLAALAFLQQQQQQQQQGGAAAPAAEDPNANQAFGTLRHDPYGKTAQSPGVGPNSSLRGRK